MGMMMGAAADLVTDRTVASPEDSGSIADLFLAASRELASSDARLYRSLDQHLKRTREVLTREEQQSDSVLRTRPLPPAIEQKHSYERQTRRSLQDLCRDHGISGCSRMTKKVMIEHLLAKGVEAPQIPLEALSKAELIAALRDVIQSERNGD
jgi:hypothetical protein